MIYGNGPQSKSAPIGVSSVSSKHHFRTVTQIDNITNNCKTNQLNRPDEIAKSLESSVSTPATVVSTAPPSTSSDSQVTEMCVKGKSLVLIMKLFFKHFGNRWKKGMEAI